MNSNPSFIRRVDQSGILLLIVRLFLGAFFIYTGAVKALGPVEFLKGVRLYGMLPESPAIFLNSTAIVLPWLEIVCGAALMLGVWIRGAGVQIVLMMLVFMPAIFLRAMAVGAEQGIPFFEIKFDCGCGTGPEVIWIKLGEDAGLLLLALLVIVSRSRRFCLDLWLDRRRSRPVYCQRCGFALHGKAGEPCDSCTDRAPLPHGIAPDAAA